MPLPDNWPRVFIQNQMCRYSEACGGRRAGMLRALALALAVSLSLSLSLSLTLSLSPSLLCLGCGAVAVPSHSLFFLPGLGVVATTLRPSLLLSLSLSVSLFFSQA